LPGSFAHRLRQGAKALLPACLHQVGNLEPSTASTRPARLPPVGQASPPRARPRRTKVPNS